MRLFPGEPRFIYLDSDIPLQIADINIGILYIFGVVSMGVYGIMIGGWASNNKFSLLAAIRGASQMISYELAMGLGADRRIDDDRFFADECDRQQPDSTRMAYYLSATWVFNIFYLCIGRM